LKLKMKVAIIPIDGGEPVKMLDTPGARHHWSLQWTPDGRGLLFAQTLPGSATIWRLPLNGQPPEKILDITPGQIMDFAWSRDGQQFVYARATSSKDVVSITGFK
jgi:Tol biopolymer transport system component